MLRKPKRSYLPCDVASNEAIPSERRLGATKQYADSDLRAPFDRKEGPGNNKTVPDTFSGLYKEGHPLQLQIRRKRWVVVRSE